ncbi:MAG: hypothetical protein DYG89_40770 [Caldilinea sp. CFX5]|nr:hypothetical protein [Caldilinea sp. CFX5]
MSSTANYPLADQQAQPVGASTPALPTGDGGLLPQTFDGYRIIDRLGGGAMATVYRAVDTEADQPVALKVLAPGADDILRERFRTEARTVSNLAHPHIVQTLRVGQVQNAFPYIAMELVEGDSLASLLERQNQLSVADSCLLLEPIARALAYAHSQHVIHRDVKPSNILLRTAQPGEPHSIQLSALPHPVIPLLSDFGIARALDAPELTSVGRTIGTPAYMSPEQCAGTRNLDGRADIYSLATVLYRCLVGRPPFMGATTQILHAHVYEALTIPDAIAKALPPAMLNILQRALQKNPEDRYADMALFANDLAALLRYLRVPLNGAQEATLTLPMLAALQPEQEKKTAHVLVSGVTEQNVRAQSTTSRGVGDPAGAGEVVARNPLTGARTTQSNVTVASRADANAARRRPTNRPTNWVYVTVASLLSVALFVLLSLALVNLLPNRDGQNTGPDGQIAGALLPTAAAVITATTAPTSTLAPVDTPAATTVATPAARPTVAGATTQDSRVSATDTVTHSTTVAATGMATATLTTPTAPTATTTVSATDALTDEISVDIGATWQEDVLYFHQEREWRQARRQALEVIGAALQQEANISVKALLELPPGEQTKLIIDNLLKKEDAPFWQQWQATIPITQVKTVLFDTYVGIANQANKARRPAEALAYFDAALQVRDDDPAIVALNLATARYANAIGETTKALAADALSLLYNDYATLAAEAQAFCSAAEYLSVANAIAENSPYTDRLQHYQQQCGDTKATPTPEALPAQQGGTFIYSTQEGSVYRIYRATTDGATHNWVLLVENGTQPGVSPDGRTMAFFSRRSDSEGISLYNFTAPLAPQAIYPRLSSFIEDSRISAPSWSPESNRVAFASDREGDRRFRVYVAAPPALNGTAYTLGEDPAWSPRLSGPSRIAYKGANETGNNVGLWLIDENGGNKAPLTNNGSDRRPVWSPDGQYVVFMRDVGANNWELFRVRVADGSELQLTNHPAQDGLPTISPDGRWVAFASDREGKWAIWEVPLAGGSEQMVMPMQGVLNNWLEHAIQWVK